MLSKNQQLSTNDDASSIQKLSISEQTKLKRNALLSYAMNPSSTSEAFESIMQKYSPNAVFTVNEALELAQCNMLTFPYLNMMFSTNYRAFYNRKIGPYVLHSAKESNVCNFPFSKVSRYPAPNPYSNQGVSNKDFNDVWKAFLKLHPEVKDSDKDLICSMVSFEALKQDIGYDGDQKRQRVVDSSNDDNTTSTQSLFELQIPTTKGELYEYWRKLCYMYNNMYSNHIFGDIASQNSNDLLADIKVVFLFMRPNSKDQRLLCSNENDAKFYGAIIHNMLQLKSSSHYIKLNVCPCKQSKEDLLNNMSNVFSKVLDCLPKDCVLVPCDEEVYASLLGCNDPETYYKLNKHLISGMMLSSCKTAKCKELVDYLYNGSKIAVKRVNTFSMDNVINNIKCMDLESRKQLVQTINDNKKNPVASEISSDVFNMSDVAPSTFQHSNKQYTFSELEQILSTLDGYTITYISNKLTPLKNASRIDKRGCPYVVLRKGNDKRFYYVDPDVVLGYTTRKLFHAEEPISDLIVVPNVTYSQRYKVKEQIVNQCRMEGLNPPQFYNDDFASSIYISSYIRHTLNYKEGIDSPKVGVLDFETEYEATTVKPTSKSINAKCRIASLFDMTNKEFHCCVLKDSQHHQDVSLADITSHDDYKVNVYECYDERELWQWLNEKLIELDFDIITGWNVEKFDLTYAIIRCKTLGIPFRNKYGDFTIMFLSNEDYTVGVDGCVILDYMKLYKYCKSGGSESWKLDYICQTELKKGKRKMIVDNHDEMYFNYLKEYFLYNLEDDERIYDLEKKLNYIAFNSNLIEVCNVSWDEIYSKTKLIDGLVCNYAWVNHRSLIRSRLHNEEADNILKNLTQELKDFVSTTGITTIDDGALSLLSYIQENEQKILNLKKDDKGYQGAIVLTPQKGGYDYVADLDASQMYPRLMIRSNIFTDTLCAVIAYKNEEMAEAWIYNRDSFPKQIPVKMLNTESKEICMFTKEEFEAFLSDKILTPFGTIFWKASVKRSLVSDILIDLIAKRAKYSSLKEEATEEYTKLKEQYGENDPRVINQSMLIEKGDNQHTNKRSTLYMVHLANLHIDWLTYTLLLQ